MRATTLVSSFLALLLLACNDHPSDQPASEIETRDTPTVGIDKTAAPTDVPSELAAAFNGVYAPHSAAVSGSGYVEDGPFTFYVGLYSDPRLGANDPRYRGASWMSDLRGVGAQAIWLYRGPSFGSRDGEIVVRESYGTLPELIGLASYRNIEHNECDGRLGGGILLPEDAGAGDDISLAIKLQTDSQVYGAALTFTLASGPNGLAPNNIRVEKLAR